VLVLLIVCANLANLLLSRAAARQHEMGVRMALGAGRARLVRQLLVESAMLAVPGALVGIALAWWGRGLLSALVPSTGLPLDLSTRLDLRVVAFVVLTTLVATVLLGTAPALRLSSRSLTSTLRSGARGVSHARSKLRGAFVVVQVALSLVALASAALFLRTLSALRQVDPGFHGAEHVLLVPTDFGFAGTRDVPTMRTTVDRIIGGVRGLPGVTSVAVGDWVPMGVEQPDTWTTAVPGHVPRPGESSDVMANHVTPDYFTTMGIPILRGRAFRETDRGDAPMVVVVNEAFVRQFFDGREPVGQAITVGMARTPNATVVGVVKDGIYDPNKMRDPTRPFMYLPYAQASPRGVTVHVRSTADPRAIIPAVRRAIADVAPALPVLTPTTLDERVRTAFFLQRIGSTVLGALGAVAVVLAALGLYGVVAYAVAQRTREVGIRMALGARRGQVITVFLEYGLKLTFLGLGLGLVGALWAGRLLTNQLYGVSAADPLTLGGVAVVLAGTAMVAAWIPARRAARVDPIVAIRTE
jgi:predicted permease